MTHHGTNRARRSLPQRERQGGIVTRRRLIAGAGLAGTALALGWTGAAVAGLLPGGRQASVRLAAPAAAGAWDALRGVSRPSLPETLDTGGPAVAVSQAAPTTSTAPEFADVAAVDPDEGLLYLAGRHPRYPGANLDSLMGYSPAVILETMDTDVLDSVHYRLGGATLARVYDIIARSLLDALVQEYGGAPVVLALDAGHGGKRGVYYDPGSQGTEADHTRQVVQVVEQIMDEPRYRSVTVRRIFNDEIGDDFGMPPPNDRKGAAALTLRNVRASMLAHTAAGWNATHPDDTVAVHLVSVHFNAGSGGILVLHQGTTVPDAYYERSVSYAQSYLDIARPALNNSGLLPYTLRLALGNGLSDDHVLYEPQFRFNSPINPYTGVDRTKFPRRYAMLQTSLLQRDYADGALRFRGLV